MSSTSEELAELCRLLDHGRGLGHLDELLAALRDRTSHFDPSQRPFAIGLDANILLNLGKGRGGADVVDYLNERHEGPVILPAQVVLEFWNSHVGGVTTLADRLRKEFNALASTIGELDPHYQEFGRQANALLANFESRYGHVMQERVAAELVTLFEGLQARAIVPQLPRAALADTASLRARTKTPPGFKDTGDGDFFVWAEFLFGLAAASRIGSGFEHVVFVTDDRKSDWSTQGTAHPILCAEIRAWTGVGFETWTLQALQQHVAAVLGE